MGAAKKNAIRPPVGNMPLASQKEGQSRMRRPGREFGSEKPKVIYVALRWNDPMPLPEQEEKMGKMVARKLEVQPTDLRIYNLVRPSKGRGMNLDIEELEDVEDTIKRIKTRANQSGRIRRIVIGGKSGPMPMVALLLKFLLPKIRVEIRIHHKARAVNGPALSIVKVIRQ